MQTSAQQHRDDAPDASKKVGSAATDLAESNLSAGLARSAMELERGRGLQAATRERLITEAMENLENDLNQAARVAANEARQQRSGKDDASPEELLAELSELRRAWAQAQANARNGLGPNGPPLDPNDPRRAFGPNGQRLDPNDPRNAFGPNGQRLAQRGASSRDKTDKGDPNGARDANSQGAADPQRTPNSQMAGGNSPNSSSGQDSQSSGDSSSNAGGASPQGGANGARFANNGANIGGAGYDTWGGGADWGYRGPYWGLRAWNPPLNSGALRPGAEFRPQADEIARRLRDMLNRMPQNALAPADISALRQLVNRLRKSNSDDPMEAEYKNMGTLVDQLELAALSASEKTRKAEPTHTEMPAVDSPEYREQVAEYYRRLGGTK
jgi:hypothetical protein